MRKDNDKDSSNQDNENLEFKENINTGGDLFDAYETDEAVDYRSFCENAQTVQENEPEGLNEVTANTPTKITLTPEEPPTGSEQADTPAFYGFPKSVQPALITFYNFFYLLGLQSFRYGKRVLVRLGRLCMRPVRYVTALARVFVFGVDRVFFKSVHATQREFAHFHKEIKSAGSYLRRAFKEGPVSGFATLSHYRKKAFNRHKEMFRSVFNLALPVAALLILLATLTHWNSITYSLELIYNGASIGYVQSESVYIQAQGLVNEQLGTLANAKVAAREALEVAALDEAAELDKKTELDEKIELKNPEYKLALVALNELSDEATLSDNLIENSTQQLTPACGIFIDGKFEGAVKNETDATGVFESLLAPYKTDDPTTSAAFVEDVRFSQGLYSVNTKIMDASELKDKLATKKAEAVVHTVKDGETIWSIAMANGLSESALLQMNPNQGQLIKTGDKLKVSNEVNFIRVKLIKTEVRTVEVPFETIKTNNPKLFKGDTRIVRKGVTGKESVTELVTYIDNTRVSAQEIDRKRLSDPTAQKTDVGTKSTKVSGSSGSYNVKVSNEGFVWPVPGYYNRVSSPFGYRSRGFHSGVDISGSGINGKVIVAAKDGVVESVGRGNSGLGHQIAINHGGGLVTRYGHCLSGSISVSPGQRVSAGQAIARVGSTGNSTGPHLHFEVRVNGSAVNPLPYIR